MTIDLSFAIGPARCALCGREVTADDAIVLERMGPGRVETVLDRTHLTARIVSGERLVVCSECGPPDVWPTALYGGD